MVCRNASTWTFLTILAWFPALRPCVSLQSSQPHSCRPGLPVSTLRQPLASRQHRRLPCMPFRSLCAATRSLCCKQHQGQRQHVYKDTALKLRPSTQLALVPVLLATHDSRHLFDWRSSSVEHLLGSSSKWLPHHSQPTLREQGLRTKARDAHKLARATTCNRNKEHPLLRSVWCHWHRLHSISRVRYTDSKCATDNPHSSRTAPGNCQRHRPVTRLRADSTACGITRQGRDRAGGWKHPGHSSVAAGVVVNSS